MSSATNSLLGFLQGEWQGVVGFILGVCSLIIGELALDYYRRRRDEPKLRLTAHIPDPEDQGIVVMLTVRNDGKTPALECASRIIAYTPKLIVDGKLTHLEEHDALVSDSGWLRNNGDITPTSDLYPTFDGLATPLAGLGIIKGDHFISLLSLSDNAELMAFSNLQFSLSARDPKPTTDFVCAFVVWVRAKTMLGGFVQDNRIFLLKVPRFGDQTCNFREASITEAHLDKGLESFLASLGLNVEPPTI